MAEQKFGADAAVVVGYAIKPSKKPKKSFQDKLRDLLVKK